MNYDINALIAALQEIAELEENTDCSCEAALNQAREIAREVLGL